MGAHVHEVDLSLEEIFQPGEHLEKSVLRTYTPGRLKRDKEIEIALGRVELAACRGAEQLQPADFAPPTKFGDGIAMLFDEVEHAAKDTTSWGCTAQDESPIE